jgi:Cu+-exporting ATPase
MIPYRGTHSPLRRMMAEATDPVCGMAVETTNPPGGTYEYENVIYYFCAPGCREDFIEDPAPYLGLDTS